MIQWLLLTMYQHETEKTQHSNTEAHVTWFFSTLSHMGLRGLKPLNSRCAAGHLQNPPRLAEQSQLNRSSAKPVTTLKAFLPTHPAPRNPQRTLQEPP